MEFQNAFSRFKILLYFHHIMKRVLLLLLFSQSTIAQNDTSFNVNYFTTQPNINIRALEVLSDTKAWFAANKGVWGYTEDAGNTWHIDSIKIDEKYPQFRSIAVLNDSTVLLLSIESPAYLFKTTNKGKTWKLVYKNTHTDIFFDSMQFADSKNGIAIADPIDGCHQLIKTNDGGETWTQINCANLPKAEIDEGLFATSNTNIDVHLKHIWFATGGIHSRIFHSTDGGNNFKVSNSPLPQGQKMTGIYSIDFFNKSTGIIVGGNYDKTDSSITSAAFTKNAGKTWTILKHKKAFFGACVRFKNSTDFFITGHDGTYRGDLKTKKIIALTDKNGNHLKFHTLRFSPSGKTVWLAGANGKIGLISGLK